jgi:hypothetical protein
MKKLQAVVALAFILLAATALLIHEGLWSPLSQIGYLTGTQGLEAEFHSLNFNNSWCSVNEKPSWANQASSWSFGYTMDFDPDVKDDGWADLCASQQPMTLDADVEPKHYSWDIDKGEVTLPNGTKAKQVVQFEMWRYRLTWKINIWMSGTEAETCDTTYGNIVTWEPNYGGTKIWIKLVPRRFLYFTENPDLVFFAPAYLGLENCEVVSVDKDGKIVQNDPDMTRIVDLIPKARGETLGIYYQRGGTPINLEDKLLSYQGLDLDTSVFRNEYWARIDLLNFKPVNWFDWQIWHGWKFPSVYLEFTAYVFVVGKWTVYLSTGEVPQLEPHKPSMWSGNPITDFFNALGAWASNPLVQLWLFFIIIVIVIIVISVLSPGLWTALASRKSRKPQ